MDAKRKLKPFKCPECGHDEIALDFPAIDRRYVMGVEEDGTVAVDEDRYDTLEEDGVPSLCCIGCGHQWESESLYEFYPWSDYEGHEVS